MRQQTLRLREGWARITPWRGGGAVAQLVVSQETACSRADLLSCVDRARAAGYDSIVTSAVGEDAALGFVDAGFERRERLHLLELVLVAPPPEPAHALDRAGRRDRSAVLALDDASFDPFWRLGPVGLRDALTATPVSRYRVGRDGRRVVAYAITGLAGPHGYLQRVAVHPDARREGWGRTVVADALGWLWRNGVGHVSVNTQLHNERALALYESFGFERLPGGLCVLGRAL